VSKSTSCYSNGLNGHARKRRIMSRMLNKAVSSVCFETDVKGSELRIVKLRRNV